MAKLTKNSFTAPPDLPNKAVISSENAGWESIQLALFHQPPHCVPEHVSRYHTICINAGTSLRLVQTVDGQTEVGDSVAGDISIYPAYVWQTFQWQESADFLQLYIQPTLLNQIGSELYGNDDVLLLPRSLPSDPIINHVALTLQSTLKTNNAGSKLYADTLGMAIATHLVYHYTSCSPSRTRQHLYKSGGKSDENRLSPVQLKLVTDYIQAHLEQDLSLAELAKLVRFSPFYFARLFKKTTGFAPHQYHIHCRIHRAKALLKRGELSFAQIAQVTGFSSQSHFNYHFKRIVEMTPTEFCQQ